MTKLLAAFLGGIAGVAVVQHVHTARKPPRYYSGKLYDDRAAKRKRHTLTDNPLDSTRVKRSKLIGRRRLSTTPSLTKDQLNYFTSQPDMARAIFSKLPIPSVLNACNTSVAVRKRICTSSFWEKYLNSGNATITWVSHSQSYRRDRNSDTLSFGDLFAELYIHGFSRERVIFQDVIYTNPLRISTEVRRIQLRFLRDHVYVSVNQYGPFKIPASIYSRHKHESARHFVTRIVKEMKTCLAFTKHSVSSLFSTDEPRCKLIVFMAEKMLQALKKIAWARLKTSSRFDEFKDAASGYFNMMTLERVSRVWENQVEQGDDTTKHHVDVRRPHQWGI